MPDAPLPPRSSGGLAPAVLLAMVVLTAVPAHGQLAGFASVSYGYHDNPLYNYERIPDQLRQAYLELQYLAPAGEGSLAAGYTGGIMVFNAFTDRNYLEHAFRFSWRTALGTTPRPPRRASGSDGDSDDDDEGDAPVDPDSARTYLDVVLRGMARHDKEAFREFDNAGVGLTGTVRFRVGPVFVRAVNDLGLRSYRDLAELSNATDLLTIQAGHRTRGGFAAGITAAAGVKHYVHDVYDTTRFESVRTYVEKNSGKGKAGAKLIVPSEKDILVNATTTTAWQITGGLFAGLAWEGGSVSCDAIYRHNTGSGTRYLAQYANTTMLNEDIYNDFFSYEGPDLRIGYRQALPLGLQSIITLGAARKRYGAPALNLNGEEIAAQREDLHALAELWLSRYVDVGGGLGMDLAFSAGVARNQSNDDYNDYSLYQVGVSIGIGF